MGINSGKNSGSTLKVSFMRRLFGRNREEAEYESEGPSNGRDYKRPSSERSERSFEGNGYVKYSLGAGTDIYISASNDDPFIDFDEPKGEKAGGRFLGGLRSAPARQTSGVSESKPIFSNALPEIKFNQSDFEERIIAKEEHKMAPFSAPVAQTAMTSSSESVQSESSSSIIQFEEEFAIETEPSGSLIDDIQDVGGIGEEDAERLPSAPEHEERLPAAHGAPEGEHAAVTEEIIEAVADIPVTEAEAVPPTATLSLPAPYCPQAVASPAPMLMLTEPVQASEEEVEAALEGTEESAMAVMAQLPSGLYAEGIEPIADAVAEEEEVTSSSATCAGQLAETSAAMMKAASLLEYSDYAGFDFLPPVTEPVRREPRAAAQEVVTISQMPERIEIEDEVGGVMKITVAGISSDEAECSDAASMKESDIPDDGMEELCLAVDRERGLLCDLAEMAGTSDTSVTDMPDTEPLEDIGAADIILMIGEAVNAASAISEAVIQTNVDKESEPVVSYTLTAEDEAEVKEMIGMLIDVISAPEKDETQASDIEAIEETEVPKPLLSFVFGIGPESVYSFY